MECWGISARKIVRAGLGVGRVRHGFPEMTCAVGCKVKMNGFTEVILYGGFYSEVGGGEELRQWTSVFISSMGSSGSKSEKKCTPREPGVPGCHSECLDHPDHAVCQQSDDERERRALLLPVPTESLQSPYSPARARTFRKDQVADRGFAVAWGGGNCRVWSGFHRRHRLSPHALSTTLCTASSRETGTKSGMGISALTLWRVPCECH